MSLPVNYSYYLDGAYFSIKSDGLPVSNRAFRYGDFLFETIHTKANQPLLLEWHRDRLLLGMEVLCMNADLFPSLSQLHKSIEALINKNRYYTDCRVRITVFRKGEGLYTPQTNDVSILIEAKPLEQKGYPMPEKGVLVDFYTDNTKGKSPINNFKCGNSLVSILAANFKKERSLGDVLIFNSDNRIIEASSSNLFWVKGDCYYTPKVASGCVDGVMRRKIIDILTSNRMQLVETDGVTLEVLDWADEIFLTNAIVGIQDVAGYKKIRFYRIKSKILNSLLNDWYLGA